jgi:hypothetical protein
MKPVYTYNTDDVSEEFAPVSFVETLGAQLGYQYAPIADKIEELYNSKEFKADPNFDWSQAIQGHEDHARSLVGAKNQKHFDFLRNNLDRNLERRNILSRSSMSQSLMAGLLDPINFAFPIPVLKAAGAIAVGTAGIKAGAVAGVKGGLLVGGISEAIRAPFDPLATAGEVSVNLGANAVLGGVVGAAPSALRQTFAYKKTQQRNFEVAVSRGTALKDEVDGVKIDYDINLGDRSIGVEVRNNTVYVDRDIINESFYKKPWTKPDDGSTPLAQNDMPSAIEYSEFLIHREVLRSKPPAGVRTQTRLNKLNKEVKSTNKKIDELEDKLVFYNELYLEARGNDQDMVSYVKNMESISQKRMDLEKKNKSLKASIKREKASLEAPAAKQAMVDWLDKTNKEALERMTSGYALKKTSFSEGILFNAISTPLKRTRKGNYPETIKKAHANLVEHSAMSLERTERGLPTESIEQNVKRHQSAANNVISELQDLHAKNAMGREEFPTFMGTRDEDLTSFATGTKGFSEEFSDLIKLRANTANPAFTRSLTDYEKKAIAIIDDLYDSYLNQSQDVGFMQDVVNVPTKIKSLKKNIKDFEEAYRIDAIEEGSALDVLSIKKLENLEKELKFFEGLPIHKRKQKFMNRMWRSREIASNDDMRAKLVDIIERRNAARPDLRHWDDEAGEWIALDPREAAERSVDHIINEEAFDPSQASITRAKHFNHRTLGDIPDYELIDFLHTDPSILHTYVQKVGLSIEWRKFNGDKTVDQFLEQAEIDMVKNKNTVDEIVAFKRDYMADFDSLTGRTITNPERLDNRASDVVKKLTGITYLGRAYQATLGDMNGIVGQHGLKKTFMTSWFSSIDRAMAGQSMKDNVKILEGVSHANNAHSNRMVAENTRIGEQYREEKIMNSLTQKFHSLPVVGSMLTPVTKAYRHLDAILRTDKIIENSILWRDNKLEQFEIEEMARMGLDRDTAIAIADVKKLNGEVAYQKGDQLWFANITEWPGNTPKEREIKRKFVNALENGMHNTVVIATAADKPIIVRGAAYVQYRSYHKAMGYTPDSRVSYKGKQMVKVSSGAMSLPFVFQSFGLGALPRIVGRITDPIQKNRVTQALTGIGMGYAVLYLRKPDWWREQADWQDLLFRSVDYSGLAGIYGDIFYTSLEMMAGAGVIDEKTSFIKPKYYGIDETDALAAPFGAPAGLMQGYVSTIKKFVNGEVDEGVREFARNTPNLINFPIQYDFGDLAEDIGVIGEK